MELYLKELEEKYYNLFLNYLLYYNYIYFYNWPIDRSFRYPELCLHGINYSYIKSLKVKKKKDSLTALTYDKLSFPDILISLGSVKLVMP